MTGKPIVLTPEQEQWLRDNYATMLNCDIARHLGIGKRTLSRFAKARGLVKDMKAIEPMRADKARRCLRNKYIRDGFRFHPENGMESRFKKGYNAREFFGGERLMEMRRKGAEARKKTFREERARVAFGLPQRTRMRVSRQPAAKIYQRYYLKRRGYVIDEDGHTAYWTPDTIRAVKLEARTRGFFRFAPMAGNENISN